MNNEITHNRETCRFEITVDNITGYVQYQPCNGGIEITHTIVPKPIGGKGIAASLVKEALEYAKENQLKVTPTCSYVKLFFERYKNDYGYLEQKQDTKFPSIEGITGNACSTKKP